MATFTKLRNGDWGLKGSDLVAGATISVAKKDGSIKTIRVGKILWTDKATGVSIATIDQFTSNGNSNGNSNGDDVCAECGKHGARYERSDSSGLVGMCCKFCARLSRYERSFG